MLVFNKYLKELGLKENSFPFDEKDERYELEEEYGVIEAQTWSLYNTIILELYTYLRFFQDECTKGIPGPFINDYKADSGYGEWRQTLQQMVDGLKAYIEIDNLNSSDFPSYEEYDKAVEKKYKQFKKSWKLIGKYLDCLWW